MKRLNREIGVFNASAVDLFASAMGAFILISIILFPFFPNTDQDAGADNQSGSTEAADLQASVDRLRADVARLEGERNSLARQLASAQTSEASTRTGLLGIETVAQSFVLLIDMSGSMNNQGNDFRGVVRSTVTRTLLGLDDASHRIAMIGFQADESGDPILHQWPEQGDYVVLSDQVRQQASDQIDDWMDRVKGGTPTLAVLTQALQMEPEAVILLTDGAPTIPDTNWRTVIERVEDLNRGAEIHAVALGPFWENGDFVRFLTELTIGNSGDLVSGSLRSP